MNQKRAYGSESGWFDLVMLTASIKPSRARRARWQGTIAALSADASERQRDTLVWPVSCGRHQRQVNRVQCATISLTGRCVECHVAWWVTTWPTSRPVAAAYQEQQREERSSVLTVRPSSSRDTDWQPWKEMMMMMMMMMMMLVMNLPRFRWSLQRKHKTQRRQRLIASLRLYRAERHH